MITTIYLSNNTVCAVEGSGKKGSVSVNKAWHMTLKEGTLINGIITDETELKNQLKRFWMEHGLPGKEVYLVLESSRLISRQLQVPRLKRKQLLEILPREFTDIAQQEEILYDFISEGEEKKQQKIRAVAAEKTYVETFLTLFAQIGVELKGISVGRNSLLQVLTLAEGIQGKNVVFQILDGDIMTSILCEDGRVSYSTQKKIFAEGESELFIGEIIRSVNRLQQFQMTQQKDRPITEVFLAGVSQKVLDGCREAVTEMNENLQICELKLGKSKVLSELPREIGGYLFAVGGLMTGKSGINLVSVLQRKQKEKKDIAGAWRQLRLLFLLFVGCSLISGALQLSNRLKEAELEELTEFLADPENTESLEAADRLKEESEVLQKQIASVKQLNRARASYPRLNLETAEKLKECAKDAVSLEIVSYDGNRGRLTLNAKTETITAIRSFIDEMQRLELLESIDYSGYEYDSGEKCYILSVEVILAERTQEEESTK